MASGAGTASTKPPNAEIGNSQTSTSIDFAALDSNHARPRRRSAWQSVEPVLRRGLGRANELAAAFDELAIERKSAHVRAAHGQLHCARRRMRLARFAGILASVAPSAEVCRAVNLVAEAQQCGVAKGRRGERDAERQSVRLEPDGNRDTREVEEIHEIRVEAEIAVESNRIGEHFGDGVLARRGRRHEHVDLPPRSLCRAAQFFQSIIGSESFGGGRPRAAANYLPRDRIQGFRMLVEELANCHIPLGDPGAFVE